MNIKNTTDNENLTIAPVPWVKQILETTCPSGYERVSIERIAERFDKNTDDPAAFTSEVLFDQMTQKYYKNIITVSGKKIRVAVNPENDPDEPLYTQEDISRMSQYLLNNGQKCKRLRNYAYFIFTINTWRRAGDNLSLKIQDVLNTDRTFKDWLIIRHEGKTDKKTATPINSAVCHALKMYLDTRDIYSMNDLLFPANANGDKMTVDGMCIMLKRAAKALGLTQKIGTHSLRKTGAYHYVLMAEDKSEAEREASQIFGHSSIQITRRYLMIEQQTLKKNFEDRKLEVKFD